MLRIDCTGRPYPGIAAAWHGSDDGRTWNFVIREDARFWDGSTITALDVVASWSFSRAADSVAGRTWRTLIDLDSVITLGERRLRVSGVRQGPGYSRPDVSHAFQRVS